MMILSVSLILPNTNEIKAMYWSKVGWEIEILSNFYDYGRRYTIQILNPTNSRGLEKMLD